MSEKTRIVKFIPDEKQRNQKIENWTSIDENARKILDRLSNETNAAAFRNKYSILFENPVITEPIVPPKWPYERNLDPWIRKWFCCRHGRWFWWWWRCCWWPWRRPILRIRKNQANLSVDEWERFLGAIDATMAAGVSIPTYQEFVDAHIEAMTTPTGQSWGAHSMGSDGRNFLAWHREYLFKLEDRLRAHNPLVTIPYWDWVNDRSIPAEISEADDLTNWGITRTPNMNFLPTAIQYTNVMANTIWDDFRRDLESIHNSVHVAVGGNMNSAGSPKDPIFWLHHAMIDKAWADWQTINTDQQTNLSETLQPTSLFTRTVADVQSITSMGYLYH